MFSGTRPTELDERDYSFHRSFGAVSMEKVPLEYNVDAGLTMPDQTAHDPYSCTAYTTCDISTDQDGIVYQPKYTYMKTLFMQGLPPWTNGSDIRPSLKSAKVYGLLPKEFTPQIIEGMDEDFTANQSNWPSGVDSIAGKLEHRKGDFYNVYDDGGMDWFDSFKSALWLNKSEKRALSIGTPWITHPDQRGVVQPIEKVMLDAARNNPNSVSWHNWKICGWKWIDGTQYLIGKPWQGNAYGDRGWIYVSRETINQLMEIRGSVAFTIRDATPEDIYTIKLGILETVLLYLYRIINVKRYA